MLNTVHKLSREWHFYNWQRQNLIRSANEIMSAQVDFSMLLHLLKQEKGVQLSHPVRNLPANSWHMRYEKLNELLPMKRADNYPQDYQSFIMTITGTGISEGQKP